MNDPQTSPAAPAKDSADRRQMLQNALAAIERLQARLDAAEAAQRQPLAVIGAACRLPGGVRDPQAFWELLVEGRDAVTEIPRDRWDVDAYYDPEGATLGKTRIRHGGFVDGLEQFDPALFGISPREAASLDPQQRLLLELSWESLERAGIAPDRLDGSLTGVFVGITSVDYQQRIDIHDAGRSDMYVATGSALNAAAGRISFTLGLQGPCMAIDTACSSSLVAIHAACQSLRTGESNLVIAGGVNIMLAPEPYVLLSKFGMLAPDGHCKTFDARADGFVRGEGCTVVVMKRLADALADGDNILAVVRGSAINQDGRSSGLTVPNGIAQQAVVRAALRASGVQPAEVSYVEAHGTGTSLGDPIEVEALGTAYGAGRPADQPLEIASVKTNIGHLEAAAGATSFLKVVLALQHRQVPGSLHFETPNPGIAWDTLPVRVSTALHDWNPPSGKRLAGVSAFGFSGMNAHVVLEEAPAQPLPAVEHDRPAHVLVLSAKDEGALRELLARHADHLQAHPELSLGDVARTLAVGRAQFALRVAVIASNAQEAAAALRAALRERAAAPAALPGRAGAAPRIAFLFTGQGAQYAGMCRELYEQEPVFREAIDRCAAVLDAELPRPLRSVLFEDASGLIDQTGCTQPALYAVEVAAAALWRSWGVEPSAMVGHSIGEFALAAVAGVFSIEDGARLVAARGRLMQALPAGGAMVSVQGDLSLLERELAAGGAAVSVAARNGPDSAVISGERAAVEQIASRLAAAGLRTQALTVSHAFHSQLMEPMLDEFERLAAAVPHRAPQIAWVSTLTGAAFDWREWEGRMGRYWRQHAREAVQFEPAMRQLAGMGIGAFVETGPHPVLCGMARAFVDGSQAAVWAATQRRNKPWWEPLLQGVAELHVRGARIDWPAFDQQRPRRRLVLPTYAFQRKRYWMEPKAPGSRGPVQRVHELLGSRVASAGDAARFERSVSPDDPAWLKDHRVGGEVVMPFTAYLESALAAARQVQGEGAAELEAVELAEPMVFANDQQRLVQVVVDLPDAQRRHRVRVFSREAADAQAAWLLHASAFFAPAAAPGAAAPPAPALPAERGIAGDDFYEGLRALGIDFGPAFRGVRQVWRTGAGEALAQVDIAPALREDLSRLALHPALFDACLQAGPEAIRGVLKAGDDSVYLPVGVRRCRWGVPPMGSLRSHARVAAGGSGSELLEIDLHVADEHGRTVVALEGLQCRRAGREVFRRRVERQAREWLHAIEWPEQPLAAAVPAAPADAAWLVLDDGQGHGAALAQRLRDRGAWVQLVSALPDGAQGAAAIDPGREAGYVELLAAVGRERRLSGVVNLWPLRMPRLAGDAVPGALQRFGTDALLHLLHAMNREAPAARLWVVTASSQRADGGEDLRVEQAPSAALARVIAAEHPELRATSVDLDAGRSHADMALLAAEILADADEPRVAYRKGQRCVARLQRLPQPPAQADEPRRWNITRRGTLDNLQLAPMQRRAPGPGEVEIAVRASCVNFRDVLVALDMYPGEVPLLGSDCAGEVVAVGEGVRHLAVGDRVVAMVSGAFATHATTVADYVAPLPDSLSFEQGAATPSAYLTAEIALVQRAGLQRGQRVLVHAAAGGVGMAAVALAQRIGAEVFATAGSDDKRSFLRRLGVQHVFDSRSAAFADEILRITAGRGVDVVLNSLAGDLLARSFDVTAEGGSFCEIGKRGIRTHEEVQRLGRGIRYHVIDASEDARATPAVVGSTLGRLLAEMGTGALAALPCTTFAFHRAGSAFRYMAQAQQIGRVVLRHPHEAPAAGIRPDASYLVTGGLRGLGWLAARWLADEGARSLVLVGRSAPDGETAVALAALQAAGVQVRVVQADVGRPEGIAAIAAALDGAPSLAGVVHCAGVLDDGMLDRQTPERFAGVMAPKADAAWRLHRLLQQRKAKPDFFVLYSSLSAVFGSPGQGNYVAANAFLDALAEQREAQGLAGLSVNWGPWLETGMAVRSDAVSRASAQGLQALAPADGMAAFAAALRAHAPTVAVVPIRWDVFMRQAESQPVPPLWASVVAQARKTRGASAEDPAQQAAAPVDLASLAPAERLQQIAAIVRRELGNVLSMADAVATIDGAQEFSTLGLDSLTSVELRNRLQQALGQSLAATVALEWPTVDALSAHVASLYGPGAPSGAEEEREEVTL
ncbi:MAG: SDR family NAD(P)-dependent oxidoreductase [Pseudomonadota bacterium]